MAKKKVKKTLLGCFGCYFWGHVCGKPGKWVDFRSQLFGKRGLTAAYTLAFEVSLSDSVLVVEGGVTVVVRSRD